ncbi:unnamed protein product [Parajaminaea phylloscopi]
MHSVSASSREVTGMSRPHGAFASRTDPTIIKTLHGTRPGHEGVCVAVVPNRSLSASPLSAASSDDLPDTPDLAMDEDGVHPASSSSDELHEDAPMHDNATAATGLGADLRPGWTTHWTSRAPPPRPLKTFASNLTSNNGSLSTFWNSRRHHPYAASTQSGPPTRGAATPSPTWPPHIGIDDQDVKPCSLPDHRASETRPGSTGGISGRVRANTVILPSASSSLRRPVPTPRTMSYSNPSGMPQREPHGPHATSQFAESTFRQRGDSFASSSVTTDSYPSTHPSSPLLFAPITPQSDVPPYQHHSPGSSIGHFVGPNAHYAPDHLSRVAKWQSGSHTYSSNSPISVGHRYGGASPNLRPVVYHEDSPNANATRHSLHEHSRMPPASELYRRSSQSYAPSKSRATVEGWQSAPQVEKPLPVSTPMPSTHQPVLERVSQSRRRRRPPYSYSSLIAQAISSAPGGRMTLREIYTWISNSYPELYSMDGPDSQGWQNTVRHNLSLNKSFVKVARTAQDIYEACASANPAHSQAARGKGGWWTIDPVVAAAQLGPNFRGIEAQPSGTVALAQPTASASAKREASPGASSDDLSGELAPVQAPSSYVETRPVHPDPSLGWTSSYPAGDNTALISQRSEGRSAARHVSSVQGQHQRTGSTGRLRGYTTMGAEVDSRAARSTAFAGHLAARPHDSLRGSDHSPMRHSLAASHLDISKPRRASCEDRDTTPQAHESEGGRWSTYSRHEDQGRADVPARGSTLKYVTSPQIPSVAANDAEDATQGGAKPAGMSIRDLLC